MTLPKEWYERWAGTWALEFAEEHEVPSSVALISDVRKATIAECAEEICPLCRAGHLVSFEADEWMHVYGEDSSMPCDASAIWALADVDPVK